MEVLVVERQPRRAASIAAMSIFFMPIITSNARFASSPPAASELGQHARRDLPGDAPLVFAPAALALLAAIADDGVPVAVGLLLIVSGDLEREGFVMLERGTAVEADIGYRPSRALSAFCENLKRRVVVCEGSIFG